jgi:hypothetical protein
MVADCKSAGLMPYVGSNPTPTMAAERRTRREGGRSCTVGGEHIPPFRRTAGEFAGVAQLVEHQPSKLRVAGSNPVARLQKTEEDVADTGVEALA